MIPTIGPLELGVVLVILLLIFGPDKLPELSKATGRALGEFKKGRKEIESEIETEVQDESTTRNS